MKKHVTFLLGFLIFSIGTYSQTGISSDGSTPDPTAMLDVKSTTKGMLVPRMTAQERDNISNPATGLLIFCTTNNEYYTNKGAPDQKNWVMVSSKWTSLNDNIFYNLGNVGIGETAPSHPLTIRTTFGSGDAIRLIGMNGSIGYGAKLNFGDGDYVYLKEDQDDKMEIRADMGVRVMGLNLAVGTLAPNSSAMLDVASTTKGMLVPRMNAVERDAISNPATGLLIFCTDDKQYYTNKGDPSNKNWVVVGSQWISNGSSIFYNGGNVGVGTSTPSALFEVAGQTKIYPLSGPTTLRLQNRTMQDYSQVLFYDDFGDYMGYMGYIGEEAPFGMRNHTIEFGSSSADITIRPGENETMRLTSAGNVGIGTFAPNSSAKLDIVSSSMGFLPPRMTKAQRDNIASPAAGLIIFNTTTGVINFFNGSIWSNLDGSAADMWNCGQILIDMRDGKSYHTALIGTQCWMTQNLNVGNRINGNIDQSNTGSIEKYCYNDLESNCEVYGGLYQWGEFMNYSPSSSTNPSGVQGICPTGWHVPSLIEWLNLRSYLGGSTVAGGELKETGTSHWTSPNAGATNSSGFTGLPGGTRHYFTGAFLQFGTTGSFWLATSDITGAADAWYLNNNVASTGDLITGYTAGYSARCVKD